MTDYILSAELSLKDRFTAKINAATKASENFKEKLKKTDSILKSFGDSRKLDKFSRKIDSVKNKISKIAFKTAKWGAVASTGALIGASKIGADFEALGARMETAFQGNKQKAAEYFKWANEFANKTPFGNEEVIDAVVRLKSYGYEDPRRLMTILGDMAGAYGKTLEQSVEAYADASRGEYERLKEFGIQKAEVINFAKKEMGKEIKMSGERVLDMDTFMKALEGLIKSRSKDGMKHLANTLSGMLSTTKGLLKYNIAKLVGVTDEGNVRAGSLIDRIKQKFEKFNTYMESEEGKKAMNKWIDAFDEALPQVIEIVNSIKEKFKEIAGESFMEKLNTSIKEFDPENFNKALDDIKERMDLMAERAMRIGGAFAGMQLFKVNPYLGIAATAAGAFSPELAKIAKQYLENEEKQKKKRNEAVENSREAQRKTGWLPKQSTATYAPRMQMIEETKTKENEKWWNFLIKDRGNGDFNFSEDDIKLKYTPEFKTPELKFKETIKNYSEKETIKEKIENIKSENEVINDFAKEIVNIDNRVFNTTTNNYIRDEKTEDNSEKSYNSLNNYESNRIDNSKSITNSEINNNSFSSQKNIDNSKSSVNNNELSNVYNSEKSNDNSKNITNNEEISNAYNNSNINTNNNSKVYNSETENKNDNSKHIVNNKEVSNTHNSSSTNNTTDNSKVYNNNTETKEVKEKVRTLKQNITNHNNITIKIDGAITNRDDKIAYENIANKLRTELQKTIDKTFENMTTEIEFA